MVYTSATKYYGLQFLVQNNLIISSILYNFWHTENNNCCDAKQVTCATIHFSSM